VYHNVPKHRVIAIAAGVTFYVLLAIFPGIAALVAIYGLIADPSTIGQHLSDLSGVLPGGAADVIGDQLQRLTAQPPGKLGFALLFGVVVSLWSANAGMKALFDALNVVYGEEEKRSFLKLNAVSLAFTLGALLFMVFALAAIAVLPVVMNYLGLSNAAEWLVIVGKWPILLIAVALAVSLVYRYGPSREKPRWRWVTWGSAAVAIAWLVMSILFSWYAANFGSYNKTYGLFGRSDRLHDLDVAVHYRGPARGRTRRRNGAPDRARYHYWPRGAAWPARRPNGGYRGPSKRLSRCRVSA
jgi:membrane protein